MKKVVNVILLLGVFFIFLIGVVSATECGCSTINQRGDYGNPSYNLGTECSYAGSGKIGVCDASNNCQCAGEGTRVVRVGQTLGVGSYTDYAYFYNYCEKIINSGYQYSGVGAEVSYSGYPFMTEARCVYGGVSKSSNLIDSKSYTKYYPDLTKEDNYYVDGFIGGDGAYCIQWTYTNVGGPVTEYRWVEQNGFTEGGKCIGPATHISYERIIGGGNKAYQIKEDDSDRTYEGIVTYKDNGPASKVYNVQITRNGEQPARYNNPVSGGASYFSFYPDCNTLYAKEPAQKNAENIKYPYKSPIKSVCDLKLANSEFKASGLCGLNSANSQGASCSDVISLPKTSNNYTVGCPTGNEGQKCYKVLEGLTSVTSGVCEDTKCITPLKSCEEACTGDKRPENIDLIIDLGEIKSSCTEDLDFNGNEYDRERFINENLPEGIAPELVWNPKTDAGIEDDYKNGENYCKEKYPSDINDFDFLMDSGEKQDCVCWVEQPLKLVIFIPGWLSENGGAFNNFFADPTTPYGDIDLPEGIDIRYFVRTLDQDKQDLTVDIANDFNSKLLQWVDEKNYEGVYIIAHSYGNIIAKQAVLSANNEKLKGVYKGTTIYSISAIWGGSSTGFSEMSRLAPFFELLTGYNPHKVIEFSPKGDYQKRISDVEETIRYKQSVKETYDFVVVGDEHLTGVWNYLKGSSLWFKDIDELWAKNYFRSVSSQNFFSFVVERSDTLPGIKPNSILIDLLKMNNYPWGPELGKHDLLLYYTPLVSSIEKNICDGSKITGANLGFPVFSSRDTESISGNVILASELGGINNTSCDEECNESCVNGSSCEVWCGNNQECFNQCNFEAEYCENQCSESLDYCRLRNIDCMDGEMEIYGRMYFCEDGILIPKEIDYSSCMALFGDSLCLFGFDTSSYPNGLLLRDVLLETRSYLNGTGDKNYFDAMINYWKKT